MKPWTSIPIKYFFIAYLVLASVYLTRCGLQLHDVLRPENMCGKTLGKEVKAPGEPYKAVIYEFNCGAMDPFSTQISILAVNEEIPFAGGNVFSSTRGERRGNWRGPYAEVEWLDSGHLHIRYTADTDVHFLATQIKGIKITSETL